MMHTSRVVVGVRAGVGVRVGEGIRVLESGSRVGYGKVGLGKVMG